MPIEKIVSTAKKANVSKPVEKVSSALQGNSGIAKIASQSLYDEKRDAALDNLIKSNLSDFQSGKITAVYGGKPVYAENFTYSKTIETQKSTFFQKIKKSIKNIFLNL